MSLSRALLIAALVVPLAAGCASASGTPNSSTTAPAAASSGSSSSPSTASSSAPAALTITAAVADGKVTPAAKQYDVPLGTPVHIEVTSDKKGEIHVHGYELEGQVTKDGGTVSIDFVANTPGLFEVESHVSDLLLF